MTNTMNKTYSFEIITGLHTIPVTSTETKDLTQSVYDRLCQNIIKNEEAFQEALRVTSGLKGNIVALGDLSDQINDRITNLYPGSFIVSSKEGCNTFCKIQDRYYLCLWIISASGGCNGKLLLTNIDNPMDIIDGDDI